GRLAPQLLQAVERAGFRREDVHDDVEVVHQDPIPLAQPLDAARQQPVLALAALEDAIVDRLRLALGVARADDEVVGVPEHTAQVELDDLAGLLVRGVARNLAEQLLGAHRALAPASVPARYSPCAAMYSATAGSTSPSIDSPSRTRSRTIEEEISTSGIF